MRTTFILSCEHGGNRIPARYRPLFSGKERLLASHRGHDLGALDVARVLARNLQCPLHAATVSRLLVDLNRSEGHPRHFSEITREFPAEERERILARHYRPHRERIERDIRRIVRNGSRVIHLAIHSFTPVLDGERRRTDIGLLFDPARKRESAGCRAWKKELVWRAPHLAVHCNRPYRGTSDGLTTALRRIFPDTRYAGVEVEINQRLLRTAEMRSGIARLLAGSSSESS